MVIFPVFAFEEQRAIETVSTPMYIKNPNEIELIAYLPLHIHLAVEHRNLDKPYLVFFLNRKVSKNYIAETICGVAWPKMTHPLRELHERVTQSLQGPVSRKSRNSTGHFRVTQFPLYLKNGEDLSRQTSQ